MAPLKPNRHSTLPISEASFTAVVSHAAGAGRRWCRPVARTPSRSLQCHNSLGLNSRRAAGTRLHVACQASKKAAAVEDIKEAHKIFDEAFITVKSGDGGNGEIVEAGRGKFVRNYKYNPGGNQPKQLWLSASDPADGADGADVYVVCDPSLGNLLHLHKRKSWVGTKGAQGNPAVGSAGPKRNAQIKKATTPDLEIPVPPGTLIKRKSTGQVLGEVIQPGDRVLVAKGGKGGMGVRAPSRMQKQRDLSKEIKNAQKSGGEIVAIEDLNWKDDAKGLPGKQLGLQLMLRVVADVGIVGFPNAGKSSLLSALTRANPEVAPYPFTTLMPNLGVMSAGQGPVLADLPGLIEGAHTGKGLGRMFLRHLRRTRVLLHVVDAAAADPGTDYLAVREELRMYNPDYVARPHVVALNKMDLEDAGALREEVATEVMAVAHQLQQQHHADIPGLTAPAAIVACSAVTGEGVQQLAAALQAALEQHLGSEQQLQQLWSSPGQQQQQQPQLQQQMQHSPAAEVAAAVSAAFAGVASAGAAGTKSGSLALQDVQQEVGWEEDDEGEGWEEDEEWEEGEEDEAADDQFDWAGSSLLTGASAAAIGQQGAAAAADSIQRAATKWTVEQRGGGTRSSDDEGEAPPPADEEDRWLFELTEEELLALADAE